MEKYKEKLLKRDDTEIVCIVYQLGKIIGAWKRFSF